MPEIKPIVNQISQSDRFNSSNRQNNQDPFSITGEVIAPVKGTPQGNQTDAKTQLQSDQNQLYSELSRGILKATADETNIQSGQMRDLVTATKILKFSNENMSPELREKIFITPDELQSMLMERDKGETSFNGEAFDILRLIARLNSNKTDAASAIKVLNQMAQAQNQSAAVPGTAAPVQTETAQNAASAAQNTASGAAAEALNPALMALAEEMDLESGAVVTEFASQAATGEAENTTAYGKALADALAEEGTVVINPEEAGKADAAAKEMKPSGITDSLAKALANSSIKAGNADLQSSVVSVLRHFDCYTGQDASLEAILQQLQNLTGKIYSSDRPAIESFITQLKSLMQETQNTSDGSNPYAQLKTELAGKDVLSADSEAVSKTQDFLRSQLMPQLSKLVSKYNQAESVRTPVMSIVHYVARYDRADAGKLMAAIDSMTGSLESIPNLTEQDLGELKTLLLDAARDIRMEQKTEGMEKSFLDSFGAKSDDGDMLSFISQSLDSNSPPRIQKLALNLLNTMIDNESPAMPLEHFMIPIDYNGQETYLEMYVDKECEGRKGKADSAVNIFFTIDSEDYGTFEVDLLARDKMIDLDIKAPADLQKEVKSAKNKIRESVEEAGFRLALYRVGPYNKSTSAAAHFEKLKKQQSGMDIKA